MMTLDIMGECKLLLFLAVGQILKHLCRFEDKSSALHCNYRHTASLHLATGQAQRPGPWASC